MFPKIQQDGTMETDQKGKPIMHEEEYFDAIQYRKDLIARVRPKTPLIDGLNVPAQVNIVPPSSSVDMSPSHIGEDLK